MLSPSEIAVGATVELFFATIALAVLYRIWGWFFATPKRQIVPAFQVGIVLREGNVEKTLSPGAYWITPKRRLILCDVRPTPFQVPSQELLTSDGMAVRISLGGEYRILNPASFVTESSDAFGAFYLELRQTVRVAVGELNSPSFLDGQALLTTRMKELLAPKAAQLGIDMTQLEIYECVPVGWLRSI
jgi:regulator of protease activity HflC (stomatin/prohibitin superfamily)